MNLFLLLIGLIKALLKYLSCISAFEIALYVFVALYGLFFVFAVIVTDCGMKHWPRKDKQ